MLSEQRLKRGVFMAVISEVKCGRCDRRYSGFRSRCPYCGARRNKRGKHADDTENAKAKLIIGVLLLVVLIAATMILILSLPGDKTSPDAQVSESVPVSDDAAPTYSEDVTEIIPSDDASAEPSVDPSASASPSVDPNVQIESVSITYGGAAKEDVTMNVGESLSLKFVTTPESTGKVAIWDTSDTSVASVIDGKVTALSKGTVTLKVTVDGVEAKCVIRVRSK